MKGYDELWKDCPARPARKSDPVIIARNAEIVALRKENWTMRKIAEKYNISRSRVGQIIEIAIRRAKRPNPQP